MCNADMQVGSCALELTSFGPFWFCSHCALRPPGEKEAHLAKKKKGKSKRAGMPRIWGAILTHSRVKEGWKWSGLGSDRWMKNGLKGRERRREGKETDSPG
jgi:hypothetical protein